MCLILQRECLRPLWRFPSHPRFPLIFFALFASSKTFVFWDLIGIEFCILKETTSGLPDMPQTKERRN
jgi:hypothetical protein